jgi:hypothetical protein
MKNGFNKLHSQKLMIKEFLGFFIRSVRFWLKYGKKCLFYCMVTFSPSNFFIDHFCNIFSQPILRF